MSVVEPGADAPAKATSSFKRRPQLHHRPLPSTPWSLPHITPDSVCRDENCDRADIHPVHEIKQKAKERTPTPGRDLWKRSSPKGLMRAIAKATSKYRGTTIGAILREVENDYGSACERQVYRYVKTLVERGQLIKLDLGLAMKVYIRPKSALLKDLDYLTETMIDQLEVNGQYA